MNLAEHLYRRFQTENSCPVPGATTAQLGDFKTEQICHKNVARWVESHPSDRAARGWLADGTNIFSRHSVIDQGNGSLIDITPHVAVCQRRFLRHTGSDDDFFAQLAQVIYTGQ